jgi:hypothetical protein
VDEVSVSEASVDEVSVSEASVDEVSVSEASVDEVSVSEASVGESTGGGRLSSRAHERAVPAQIGALELVQARSRCERRAFELVSSEGLTFERVNGRVSRPGAQTAPRESCPGSNGAGKPQRANSSNERTTVPSRLAV